MSLQAKPNAGIKFSVTREENPKGSQNTLVLPYAFSTESIGFTAGIGGGTKGYLQDQLLVAGTFLGSAEGAAIGILGMWDYKMPWVNRLFVSAIGSIGYYPNQRAYSFPFYQPGTIRPGSNDSDPEQYVETPGDDNWFDFKLEYVLPLGSAKSNSMMDYRLKRGMLASTPSGGDTWNPLESGVTVLLLKQYNRYQSYKPEGLDEVDGTIHPFQFGIYYDNTDFPANPSYGCSQYLAYTQDFAWLEPEETWSFVEFEASKYFSLGESDWAKQRVIALNLWTGSSPSWDERLDENGNIDVTNRPPFFDGATLGGFYRMRGYENNRFNDKSVIYTTAEYRYTPHWNPIGKISWLRWLHMDFWQFVGFIEGGRVANEYSFSELFSDWKSDIGIGLRAMMAGGIVRLDIATSDEGTAAWVMFGQPF
jgi:hypothetical protein